MTEPRDEPRSIAERWEDTTAVVTSAPEQPPSGGLIEDPAPDSTDRPT